MWPFNYPYTNFHELNLDWILEEIQKSREEVKNISGEIVNKLEQWKDDGTLAEIIGALTDAVIFANTTKEIISGGTIVSENLKDGMIFLTSGYESANDGGAAFWVVQNQAGDIAITGGKYLNYIPVSEYVNPRVFGARYGENMPSDDSFEKALKYGDIFLTGEILLTAPHTINRNVTGRGDGAINSSATLTIANDVKVSDITVKGDNNNAMIVLKDNVFVSNCTLTNGTKQVMEIRGSHNTLNDNTFIAKNGECLIIRKTADVLNINNTITGNIFSGLKGINIVSDHAGGRPEGCVISDCQFITTSDSIIINDCLSVNIDNCILDIADNAISIKDGLDIKQDIKIRGCWFGAKKSCMKNRGTQKVKGAVVSEGYVYNSVYGFSTDNIDDLTITNTNIGTSDAAISGSGNRIIISNNNMSRCTNSICIYIPNAESAIITGNIYKGAIHTHANAVNANNLQII